jgi:hypothetical protein
MVDLLKGLGGKSQFLVAWISAAAITVGAAVLFLLPIGFQLKLVTFIQGWSETNQGVVLIAVVSLLGFTMGASSTPLYRLLEGYNWPTRLMNWGSHRQRGRKKALEAKLNSLANANLIDQALIWERLSRYPADDKQVAPTRLGNALRVFETYGLDRYALDSQTFWNELVALVPKNLQDELDNSRAATDFFVATVYLTALYGLGAAALVGVELWHNRPLDYPLMGQAIVVLVLGPAISYRLAVSSTTYWAATVQAMVNLGRMPLAKAMGLTIPKTLEAERQMWNALTAFVFYPFERATAHALDQFRTQIPAPTAPDSLENE